MSKIDQSIIESATNKLHELESVALQPINDESTHQVLVLFFGITALTEFAHFDSGLLRPTRAALDDIEAKCAAILSARSVVIEASR